VTQSEEYISYEMEAVQAKSRPVIKWKERADKRVKKSGYKQERLIGLC